MTISPCQDREARSRTGVSKEACEAAAWAVTELGDRFRGAGAMTAAAAYAWGVSWPLRLYQYRGIRWLAERLYSLLAALRSRLPGARPFCLEYPARCEREH